MFDYIADTTEMHACCCVQNSVLYPLQGKSVSWSWQACQEALWAVTMMEGGPDSDPGPVFPGAAKA